VVGKYSTWGRCSQSNRWWESTVPGAGAVKVTGGGKVQYLGQVQSKYQVVGKWALLATEPRLGFLYEVRISDPLGILTVALHRNREVKLGMQF
jgi:hypothetical protein